MLSNIELKLLTTVTKLEIIRWTKFNKEAKRLTKRANLNTNIRK